ncbi:MAG: alpha/beta hydrolase [Eubacteriaceae bacterium]|nr:alpha/beta hydrolase [Eubacteriaceae bacterium]
MSSWQSKLIEKLLRKYNLNADNQVVGIKKKRKIQERNARILNLIPGGEFIDVRIGDIKGQIIEGEEFVPGRIILYLHGGAYCTGTVKSYRILARKIADTCRAELLIINYRLAPEHPFPGAIQDSVKAFKWLIEKGYKSEAIFLVGDSAGGGLALSTCVKLKAEGISLPAGIVCMSPWTDLTLSGKSIKTRAKRDPLLNPDIIKRCSGYYCKNEDPENPLISPVYADLTGLPKTMIQIGTEEILYDDSIQMAKALKNCHVDVSLEIYKGMFHVWQFFYYLIPEARRAVGQIGVFVERIAGSGKKR